MDDGQREVPWGTQGSRDFYLGRRATRPDYGRYVAWCLARGIRPLASEPLAWGDMPAPPRLRLVGGA